MPPANIRLDHRSLLIEFRASRAVSKLRVGIALDPRNAPAWARELIDLLVEVPHFDISLCPFETEEKPREPWFARRMLDSSRRLFDPFSTDAPPDLPLSGREFDLLLWLLPGPPAGAARYGSLSLHFGDRKIDPPYWDEVLAGVPLSRIGVRWQENAATAARMVRIAEIPTERTFPYT